MILFTNSDSIPDALFARTVVINAGKLSLRAVNEVLVRCFVDYFDPDAIPGLKSAVRAENQRALTIRRYEKETLLQISEISEKRRSDSSYDYGTDNTAFANLMHAKESYFASANATFSSLRISNDLDMAAEPFAAHVALSRAFWEALSRFMPDVSSFHRFSFPAFVRLIQASIRSCGLHQGVFPADKHSVLRDAICRHVFKAVLPTMPYVDAILFLFLAAFSLSRLQRKSKEADLESIVEHFHEEFDAKCDFQTIDSRAGEPIDQLKYSNIANFFSFVVRFINEQLDSGWLEYLPFLSTESFISSSPAVPLLINTHHCRDPTPLLETYISVRGKSNEFAAASLCEDPLYLDAARQLVSDSLQTNHWVILHFESTTPRLASFLFDLLALLDRASPDFRLLLIGGDPSDLPCELLFRCERLDYQVFPSIRLQMVEIMQHHSSTINGSSNPRAFKKISYMFALLFSILRFRSFLEPLGFTEDIILEEVALRQLLVRTKEIVDTLGFEEVPIRNFRDTLMDTEFGSSVTNSWDYRKLRWHVHSLMTPEILDEGFAIIEQPVTEAGSYLLPNDSVKVADWVHIAEKMPAFPSGDILGMNLQVSQPLRNWNLSRWIARSFCSLKRTVAYDPRETRVRLSVLLKQFPPKIAIARSDFNSPLRTFLLSEIEVFNRATSAIRFDLINALSGGDSEVYHSIEIDRTPLSWHELLAFGGTRNPTKFCIFLRSKREFLADWVSTGTPPQKIEVSYLRSLRGLLQSFLTEIAVQRGAVSDAMAYEFAIGDEKNDGPGLTLAGLNLVGGNWGFSEKALVQPNAKSLPVCKFPDCFCGAVKASAKSPHTYSCPVFRALPSRQFMLDCDRRMVGGEMDNLQWYVPLRTDIVDKQLVCTGVCLVCYLPDSF